MLRKPKQMHNQENHRSPPQRYCIGEFAALSIGVQKLLFPPESPPKLPPESPPKLKLPPPLLLFEDPPLATFITLLTSLSPSFTFRTQVEAVCALEW